MNNDISKRYKFSLDSKSNNTLNNGQLLFNYGDDITLEITVTDGGITKNIAGCEVDLITANQNSTDVLIHHFSDGGITVREDNTIVIVCKSDYVDRLGTNVGQLIIRDEDQSITTQMFSYQTSTTLVSDEISGSVDGINTIEDIMKVIANANLEIENFNRVTTGLESKIQATNMLVDNLTDRVNIEITSTNSIVNQVKLEESKRVQSEDARSSNETSRVNSETNRIQEEYVRVANEQDRVLKETQRVENETTRVSEENIRKTNEIARVEAEEYRSTKFQEMEQVYASSASEVENNRQGYDGTVYANMYEARKADYKMLEDTILTNDNVVWTDIKGENLSIDYTKQGHLREVEVWGNTAQGFVDCVNHDQIARSIVSTGIDNGAKVNDDGTLTVTLNALPTIDWSGADKSGFIQLKPNTQYSVYCRNVRYNTLQNIDYVLYEEVRSINYSGRVKDVFTTGVSGKVLIYPQNSSNQIVEVRVVEGKKRLASYPSDYNISHIEHSGELLVDSSGSPILDNSGNKQYKIDLITSKSNQYQNHLYQPDLVKHPFTNSSVDGEWNVFNWKTGVRNISSKSAYSNESKATYTNDKIYFRFDIVRLSEAVYPNYTFCFRDGGYNIVYVTSQQYNSMTVGAINTFSNVMQYTGPSLYTDLNITFGAYATDLECNFKIRNVVLINLTHLYGAGNEPTKEWCDENISYLNHNDLSITDPAKTTLLLPCQLMKVGDVKDRLYWDSEKGRYIVEKNVGIVNFTSENWVLNSTKENTLRFACNQSSLGISYNLTTSGKANSSLCSISPWLDVNIITNINGHRLLTNGQFIIQVLKTELPSEDLQGFKQYLNTKTKILCYPLSTPQLIETTILEEIKIPTYIDKTHLFVTGGLDGIIKAKVPIDGAQAIQSLSSENKELNNQVSTLSVENEELKATNEVQDELIDVTMCATDEMFNMLESLLTQVMKIDTLNTNNKEVVNPMVDMYVAMVQRGLKTIDQVPARYREQVEAILAELDK